jgi:Hemerythrin HHE cation binding domain
MTAPAELPLADTSDMIGLHQVFRDALGSAPAFVGQVADGDAARAELVGSYYANVLDLLHGHHAGEDELMTPRLLERVPESAATIARIADQHQTVLVAVANAEAAVTAWRTDPSAHRRQAAVAALVRLDAELAPHLDEEEHHVLPIAAQCINVAEWGQLPEHGMKSFRGDKLWLILGLIQEQMTPSQKAAMEAHMPPPLLEFWVGPGQLMFQECIADLRR